MKITNLRDKVTKKNEAYITFEGDGKKISCFNQFQHLWSILRLCAKSGEDLQIQLLESKGGYWNCVGIAGVETPVAPRSRDGQIKAAIEKRNERIREFADKRDGSMRSFAAKRDASLFASICHSGFGGEKQTDELINAHKFWLDYFEKIY